MQSRGGPNATCDTDVMLDALDRLRDTGPEFGGFLANHGPMAADALIRLGGSTEVDRWVWQYRLGLSAAVPLGTAVTDRNWRDHRGHIERLGDWIGYFRPLVADIGWRGALELWWPRLLPGSAASATHGLIRTAHAVRLLAERGDAQSLVRDELATALAYWAARSQLMPGRPRLAGGFNLSGAIVRLPRLGPGVPSIGPGLGGRLAALSTLVDLPPALDAWGPATVDATAFDELIGAAARIVAARSDAPIAYCHAVTAPAAVRMILPHLPAEHLGATLAACWQIVGAIVAAFAHPPHRDETRAPSSAAPDRLGLAALAVEHGDEHVI
ncbi:MAG: DUF4243 domain-containing protein, partial [Actinobacteria bacterium]|nr:DUF4243 domain-containing protein [Actinomycetota bacterium]